MELHNALPLNSAEPEDHVVECAGWRYR